MGGAERQVGAELLGRLDEAARAEAGAGMHQARNIQARKHHLEEFKKWNSFAECLHKTLVSCHSLAKYLSYIKSIDTLLWEKLKLEKQLPSIQVS